MKRLMVCCFILLFLTACFALPVEELAVSPPVATAPPTRTIRTAIVNRGNVLHYANPSATFIPAREERLAFTERMRILSIYVTLGDYVQEGDIIAALYRPYLQELLNEVIREEEWARLHLAQLNQRHELALAQAVLMDTPVDDSHYITERTRILSQLEIIRMRLDYLIREKESRYLRASFDGVVTTVASFQPNMVADENLIITTITDQNQYVFQVRGDIVTHMNIGDHFDIYINGEHFIGVVVNPEEYGIILPEPALGGPVILEAYLAIIDEVLPMVTSQTFAMVHVLIDAAYDVLLVPNLAVNRAADRYFVYVLENDIRVTRDVEIGLVGNAFTEIIWGLEEGELVVNE